MAAMILSLLHTAFGGRPLKAPTRLHESTILPTNCLGQLTPASALSLIGRSSMLIASSFDGVSHDVLEQCSMNRNHRKPNVTTSEALKVDFLAFFASACSLF
ncbi:uncharacterized protein BDV17DRAFT_204309 [Aspergillus undulatus]|uniref:uncharacterized protein n=1 Tax=Aspergillus undulatus TaxID=1810928 RepID=UPI003CCD21CF